MLQISAELKNIMLTDEMLVTQSMEPIEFVTIDGQKVKVAGRIELDVKLNLENRPDLFKECLDWMKLRDTYFQTSQRAAKLNIGPYDGLFPTECTGDGVVHFHADEFYPGRTHWRDWFVQGEKHAS